MKKLGRICVSAVNLISGLAGSYLKRRLFNRYLAVLNKPFVRLKITKCQFNHSIHVILAFHFIKSTCYNLIGYVVHSLDKQEKTSE